MTEMYEVKAALARWLRRAAFDARPYPPWPFGAGRYTVAVLDAVIYDGKTHLIVRYEDKRYMMPVA